MSMRFLFLLIPLLAASVAGAETRRSVADETGAVTWATQAHGVGLSLTQILPDQARAFYINRGFPAQVAERYATACVFMTVLRNDAAPGELSFRLADWRVRGADREMPPLSVADWLERLRPHGLPESALIAFRWAQFPPEQDYAVGEWNQGMLTTGLPAGSRFDLLARWSVAGVTYEGKLDDVHCAN